MLYGIQLTQGCQTHQYHILILNLPTNIYKSSNNKKYQQKSTNLPTIKPNQKKSTNPQQISTNLPTIKLYQQKSTNLPTNIYKSSNTINDTNKNQPVPPYTDPELPSTN